MTFWNGNLMKENELRRPAKLLFGLAVVGLLVPRILLDSGLAEDCLRILIEPAEEAGDVEATLERIEAALDGVGRPRLLHGLDASAWALVEQAASRGYDTRTGFEDTLTLPDGSPAADNAALVTTARRIVQRVRKRGA